MIITINIITIIVTVLKIFLVKVNNFKAFLQVLFCFQYSYCIDMFCFQPNTKEEFRKTWSPKFTLRRYLYLLVRFAHRKMIFIDWVGRERGIDLHIIYLYRLGREGKWN